MSGSLQDDFGEGFERHSAAPDVAEVGRRSLRLLPGTSYRKHIHIALFVSLPDFPFICFSSSI
jgi:hypothetical protein